MANPAVQVFGLASVYVDAGAGLELLGYTRDGARTTNEAFWENVPGDQYGGEAGPPIDIQYLGEIVRVRLELTKYVKSVADKVAARVRSGTSGQMATAGTLMFAGSKFMRLCISGVGNTKNYAVAIPREAIELNVGTKYSTFVCVFECHGDQGDPNTFENTNGP